MSEQTPDASNGLAGSDEPSMEDILASIRKIIADDETDVGVSMLQNDLADKAEADLADIVPTNVAANELETLDLDILADAEPIDAEIDTLIADMDVSDPEPIEDLAETEAVDAELDIVNLEIPDTENEVVPVLAGSAMTTAAVASKETIEEATEVSEGDLSLMLDDMLADVEDTDVEMSELDEGLDLAADLSSDSIDIDDDLPVSSNLDGDADIDLVKSLMADLTEQPMYDDADIEDTDESVDADIENSFGDTETDDVLDEILSLSLDDEIELQNDSEDVVEEVLSLKDIAAHAEADANALDVGDGVAVAAGLATVGATAKVLSESDDLVLEDLELDSLQVDDDIDKALAKFDDIVDTSPQTNTDTMNEETPEMPRAAKKDKIIDEVTETATADVFASLNQVVEEKAIVAERGDRIGDLVQEALRPMLKEWLDKNLKGIVERAVTKEVKRISSGK